MSLLNETQLKQLYEKCIENADRLLESAEMLLQNKRTQQYSLGLYMYAIEEFGKAHLIKECFDLTNEIPGWIFGKGKSPNGNAHEMKINKGLEKLPKSCIFLSFCIEIKQNFSEKTRTFKDKSKKYQLSVGPI